MNLILNIGLARNDGGPNNTVEQTLAALREVGFAVREAKVYTSDTEPTLVVEAKIWSGFVLQANYRAAVCLGQDCVAWLDTEEARGELTGPRAAAWGQFNPAFFLMPDGTRLA